MTEMQVLLGSIPLVFSPGRDMVGEFPTLLHNQSQILLAGALLSFQGAIKLDDLLCIVQSFTFEIQRAV